MRGYKILRAKIAIKDEARTVDAIGRYRAMVIEVAPGNPVCFGDGVVYANRIVVVVGFIRNCYRRLPKFNGAAIYAVGSPAKWHIRNTGDAENSFPGFQV